MVAGIPNDLIPLRAVPKMMPVQVSFHTVWRWTVNGVGDRKLPTWKIGGRRMVSQADLTEFIQRLSEAPLMPERRPTQKQYDRRRQKSIDAAREYLDKELGPRKAH